MKLTASVKSLSRVASQAFFPTARSQTGFFRQSSRLRRFSEEVCFWNLTEDVSREGPVQFCVSADSTFHLLSVANDVFGICSIVPWENKEKRLYIDLSESLPGDRHAQMLSAGENQLALFLPSYDTLFFLSAFGGSSRVLRLGGNKSPFSRSKELPVMHQSESTGKFYFCGDGYVRILTGQEVTTVTLPLPGISHPIGNDEFLLDNGIISQSGGKWRFIEVEADDAIHWSPHRTGKSSSSFVQILAESGKERRVMISPRSDGSPDPALVQFSPKIVVSAYPSALEVVTLDPPGIRTIAVERDMKHLQFHGDQIYGCSSDSDGLTVVSKYDTQEEALASSLVEWKTMWGLPLELASSRLSKSGTDQVDASKLPPEASQPKHGKVDDKPHVGGNTWAGGTGGSDTAGLGGRGGPYRLDKGNPVHQLSDELKQQVDADVLARARELGKLAFQERLKEIGMNPEAHSRYTEARTRVRSDLERLRAIFASADAQRKERSWERYQSFGVLDDARLVDGLCGERQIYKRRVFKPPSPGTRPSSPLNIRVVVDVSASMYRFQSMDGRLQRMVDTTLMLLEAVKGEEARFRLSVVGHSGEDANIDFVPWDKLPRDEAKTWNVLEEMAAHSQYCLSGDTTVEAVERAVSEVLKQDEEQGGLVIVVSDANLRRYGIAPREIARRMTASDKVRTYVVFIASVREEAEVWARELPAGRARVCLETADLPHVMRDILADSVAVEG